MDLLRRPDPGEAAGRAESVLRWRPTSARTIRHRTRTARGSRRRRAMALSLLASPRPHIGGPHRRARSVVSRSLGRELRARTPRRRALSSTTRARTPARAQRTSSAGPEPRSSARVVRRANANRRTWRMPVRPDPHRRMAAVATARPTRDDHWVAVFAVSPSYRRSRPRASPRLFGIGNGGNRGNSPALSACDRAPTVPARPEGRRWPRARLRGFDE
jgi:hypothetical protein